MIPMIRINILFYARPIYDIYMIQIRIFMFQICCHDVIIRDMILILIT